MYSIICAGDNAIENFKCGNPVIINLGLVFAINSMNMLNSNHIDLEREGWRSKFFSKELCEGVIENKGDGNIEITGKLKISKNKIQFAVIVLYFAIFEIIFDCENKRLTQ